MKGLRLKWIKSPNLIINVCTVLVVVGMVSYGAGYAFSAPVLYKIAFWLVLPMLVFVAMSMIILVRAVFFRNRRQ